MLKYGVRESWIKEFIFTSGNGLYSYSNGSIRKLEISTQEAGFEHGFAFAESLVSLKSRMYVDREHIRGKIYMQALIGNQNS